MGWGNGYPFSYSIFSSGSLSEIVLRFIKNSLQVNHAKAPQDTIDTALTIALFMDVTAFEGSRLMSSFLSNGSVEY
ncbi:MAG TPA: hypothetical protein VJP58_08785 [Candidatus Nitrosocosmicus sp.]|nr:hypothetical protein [Candidatus Nitrosocosmicus sp.]